MDLRMRTEQSHDGSSQSAWSREQWLSVTTLYSAPSVLTLFTLSGRGLLQPTPILSCVLSGGGSCELENWVYPNKIVRNFPKPKVALPCHLIAEYSLLLVDFGSQESKSKNTPVTHKRSKAKNRFGHTSLFK